MNDSRLIFLAHILNPVSDHKCEFIKDGALVLKKVFRNDKWIYLVENKYEATEFFRKLDEGVYNVSDKIVDYTGHVIIPAFFDLHFHWVQDDVREMPKANLLEWLKLYTFPTEKKFEEKKYALNKAKSFFKKLTQVGTLGGGCYSSVHEHAVDYAMKNAIGDFIIGNVLMTMNSPDFLTQTKEQAIVSVNNLLNKYGSKYAVTPRFAISTDPETMRESATLAKKNACFIQSHLSETRDEINFVIDLYQNKSDFKHIKTYTEIYKKTNVLGPRTIMAHGIHLQKEELEILQDTHTSIAHCPTSNAEINEMGLESGLLDFKQLEKYQIPWALGSDIGGGPVLSMFDVIRSFVDQNANANIEGATYQKALYRATLASAEILKIDDHKGNLDNEKEANFLILPKIKSSTNDTANSIIKHYIQADGHDIAPQNLSKRLEYDNVVEKVYYQGYLVYAK